MSARGSSTRMPSSALFSAIASTTAFGAELVGDQVDFDAVSRELLGGSRTDGAQPRPVERSDVPVALEQRLHERIDRVDAREHDPIEGVRRRRRLQQRSAVFRRRDSDHRCLDGVGAKRGETIDEVSGLLARASDEHAAPEKRAGIEPAQVLSKSDHASNDQRCRLTPRVLAEPFEQLRDGPGERLLVGQRAVVDEDALGVGSPAVGAQRLQDVCQLLGACVAHDGAVEAGEARPIDIGQRRGCRLRSLEAA